MPPPEAIAGTYVGPDGKKLQVPALTDEDKRTLVRWIDLGCPIDLDHDKGWFLDDQRLTLTLTSPQAGPNVGLPYIVVGMHDTWNRASTWRASRSSPTSRSTTSCRARTWRRSFGGRPTTCGNIDLAGPIGGLEKERDGVGEGPPGGTRLASSDVLGGTVTTVRVRVRACRFACGSNGPTRNGKPDVRKSR